MTGQSAWWSSCWPTEPSSLPTSAPWPRLPTMTRAASRDTSIKFFAGLPGSMQGLHPHCGVLVPPRRQCRVEVAGSVSRGRVLVVGQR